MLCKHTNPVALLDAANVHVLDADGATVSLTESLHDLPEPKAPAPAPVEDVAEEDRRPRFVRRRAPRDAMETAE